MEREKLIKTLNAYACSHVCEKKHPDDSSIKATIKADIMRQQFDVYLSKDRKKQRRLYKMMLYLLLKKLCTQYTQGMCEVAVVVVNVFFKEKVMKDDVLEFLEDDDANLSGASEEEKRGFEEFCSLNKDECKKAKNALQEIFKQTYEPLWKDKFKLYKKYFEVFLEMMKDRGVEVVRKHPYENLTHILTFFTRICRNENLIYRIFNIILNNEVSVLFTLLVLLYKHTESESASSSLEYDNYLKKLPSDFEEQVKKTNNEFLEMQKKMKNLKKIKKCRYLILGVGISIAVAAGMALYNKKQ